MPTPRSGRQAELRKLVLTFLSERHASKTEKLSADDPKHAELRAQFHPATWLADAARRVGQLQAVTHSLKPIHPDAKGSSLFVAPSTLPQIDEVGSHCLGDRFDLDVVGNAAALDTYKFLKLEFAGHSLLHWCQAGDADLAAALSDDAALAQDWMAAFAKLTSPRGNAASHTNAKQLYWLVGDNPHDDAAYELLAPLYPTSLVQRFYDTLQDDRFGEPAKAARAARKAQEHSATPVLEYAHLAVQQLGGTKPQNISQLNSERRGNNLLLASLPPSWRSREVQPLLGAESLFTRFARRQPVRIEWTALQRFLEREAKPDKPTRDRVRQSVDTLVDELLFFTAELRSLAPGWSLAPDCILSNTQKRWLDPQAPRPDLGEPAVTEAIAQDIASGFANWLNARLRKPLAMGDPEHLEWRRRAFKQLWSEDWELADVD